jgi:hypothetical protein
VRGYSVSERHDFHTEKSSFRIARYSIAILKSTIEMAVCKSLMAPVLAIDSSITRGLRGGAEDEDHRV